MNISIDEVLIHVLTAIYSNDVLNSKLYLKGGQALRLVQNIKSRLSTDIDFSLEESLETNDVFFTYLENALSEEFKLINLNVIDFKAVRKPKIKKTGDPDFWGGWAITFKLITDSYMNLPLVERSAKAILPEGAGSSNIPIDISEHEYCDSFDIVKVASIEVKTYSRVLLVLEKIRAICQSHPSYKLRKRSSNRARDFYDIEQLYSTILNNHDPEIFFGECKKHLKNVFSAKDVPLTLLNTIGQDSDFLENLERGWDNIQSTIKTRKRTEPFSYYLEILKSIIVEITD